MGRPKKTDDQTLVQIVEEFFTTEAAGNPRKLKYSLIEKYAASKSILVKAYDFRRSQAVREKIAELQELSGNENGVGILSGGSYKSLDLVNLLANRRDLNDLLQVLGDIDSYWKSVFEASSQVAGKNKILQKENDDLNRTVTDLKNLIEEISSAQAENKAYCNDLVKENRYLRSVIKKYLYPALANELLVQEQALQNPDTSVTEVAKRNLLDGTQPSSFTEAVSQDQKVSQKLNHVLEKMWESI